MSTIDRMLNGSAGMQYARMAEQLGLPSNLAQIAGAQMDAARGDFAGVQRLLQAATQGLSTGQMDSLFGKGLPPQGFVPRPMSFMSAAVSAAATGIDIARGFNPFGGVSRESPFGTGFVGRSVERAIRRDPMFKAQLERQLGGVIIPDRRNDGKLTIWRPPFSQVGGIMREALTAGMLPKLGIAAALGGLGIPMAGALAANAVAGGILRGMQRLEGNISSLMAGNNVDGARASLVNDPEAMQHANGMGIDVRNASFEDIMFLLLMKYAAKKEKEIMNKVKQLDQSIQAGEKKSGKGGLGGILGSVGGIVGNMIAPGVGGMVGGALGNVAGGMLSGAGGANHGSEAFDAQGNMGDPSKMSETMKQQALQKLMGDLQKLYEMLSNMIKSMHDMQMTPVRNLRG